MPEDAASQLALDKAPLHLVRVVHAQNVRQLARLAEKRERAVHLPHGLAAEVVPAISERVSRTYAIITPTCVAVTDE